MKTELLFLNALKELQQNRIKPTLKALREAMGNKGSYTTIKKLMNRYVHNDVVDLNEIIKKLLSVIDELRPMLAVLERRLKTGGLVERMVGIEEKVRQLEGRIAVLEACFSSKVDSHKPTQKQSHDDQLTFPSIAGEGLADPKQINSDSVDDEQLLLPLTFSSAAQVADETEDFSEEQMRLPI